MQTLDTLLKSLDVDLSSHAGHGMVARSPVDGSATAQLQVHTASEIAQCIVAADAAFHDWRNVPAPRRGELVRLFAERLRRHKQALGLLVTLETGKIEQEGLGEVQEMIDICDFAVGLSRQLYGLTIASERPGHRMMETWHPIGVVGVISAFNFPVAVWAWNAALALVCGNSVVWKPSEKAPLTAIAVQALFLRACAEFGGEAPAGLSQLIIGGRESGEMLVDDARVRLVSATGSTRMGRAVAQRCASRFARTILELGGNNAMIVAPSADLDMALRAIVFSAVGTAGQRCTSLRRLFVHHAIHAELLARLKQVYAGLPVGHPMDPATLVGPLIDEAAFHAMQDRLRQFSAAGARITGGGRVQVAGCESAYYVQPALVELAQQTPLMHEETFAPILAIVPYADLAGAIAMNNAVPQGLSSSIFTNDLREAEGFLSASGSDCGIANVNIGPSGAEIGGAFGGEKETGGGRESGSDAWKAYMRRATNTVNYSHALPLAQEIRFGV